MSGSTDGAPRVGSAPARPPAGSARGPSRAGSAPVLAERPRPGTPRPYEFPPVERTALSNGLRLWLVDLPGRPLATASLVLRNGAADEPPTAGGATVLAARALAEGTERHDAVALVEAAERLGAALHAEAGWDAASASVEVPVARLEPALELLAEMVAHPTFPEHEVERLREERLNDLLQARADPRRRAEEAFAETIYTPASPYSRPAGGRRETVEALGRAALRAAHARGFDPSRMTLIVAGELAGTDAPAIAERLFGGWSAWPSAVHTPAPIVAEPARRERFVRVIHRPGSVQTEIRVGHVGLPRRVPDFHAVSVMSTILGGLFNSRLNMKLREEKGYTYGAGAGFDMRRAAGPFAARAAVNTEATLPALVDILAELERMRDQPVSDAELRAARDFLVGVFPLRFETPGPIVGALSGLVVHDLPEDELVRYRASIEAVDVDAVLAAARTHLLVDEAQVVLVGDVDAFGPALEAARLGPIQVERDEEQTAEGPARGVDEQLGPVDGDESGPDEGTGAGEPPGPDGEPGPEGGSGAEPA